MNSAQSSPFSEIFSLPSPRISMDSKTYSLVAEEPRNHPVFSFVDDNVTFLVENTLFTIHKFFFLRDSVVFRQMFLLPPPPGQIVEGMSRDNPIILHGVSCLDFERFLQVLYPPVIGEDAFSTTEEWASVFEIADKYIFNAVRELAVRRLLDIASPIDKVILGRRYAERRLLVPGYHALCSRYNALTLEEGGRLGLEDVILIGQTRESIREADYTFSGEFFVEHHFSSRLPPPHTMEPDPE